MEKKEFEKEFKALLQVGRTPLIFLTEDGYFRADSYRFITKYKVVFNLRDIFVRAVDLKSIKKVR